MRLRIPALTLAAMAALLALSACTTDIDYFGESYPPTVNVECFFASNDIKRPYKTMGKAIATPGAFASKADFQNDIMNFARMHGADAALVETFQKVKTGQYTNWNSDGYAKAGRRDSVWWDESGSATTQDMEELRATIYFIKYTQ